jgi:uncharacterized protein (TIGR02598 family)
MGISEPTDRKVHPAVQSPAAFSLVEVTLAIGIAAFALLSVFGLVPTGLTMFRSAMDASLISQISQRIITDAQQTDYNALVGSGSTAFLQSTTPRYFDDQANELIGKTGALYWVMTRITPSTITPTNSNSNPNLATVTVQITNNPGGQPITTDSQVTSPTYLLWNDPRFSLHTFSALVARNK